MTHQTFHHLVKESYEGLSAGKKKAAKYILEHLEEASYSTVGELQTNTGVSEATIIRLAYSLGFSGFSAMQKQIREEVMKHRTYKENETILSSEYNDILQKDIELMQDLRKEMNDEQLEHAAKKIINADKVYIIGQRTSYASAYWLSYTLRFMLPSIQLVDEKTSDQDLLDMNERTVVIAISFPRYHKETYKFAEMAKKEGADIIAITDSSFSPLAKLTSLNLYTKTNRDASGYNGIASVLGLLNILVVAIRKNAPENIKKRLLKIEEIYHMNDKLFE
ncbi:MurR/RpiR family transcriptional regulator [Oceanobacillus jeddahense]|uniref:MurR/RpiR family transcriptional regulator n=1 Tax=Oceanobacillus jeddahense TaxID=1462527 RepID=UPI000595E99F|nr:MurR/RpiR family transcriptional regulator [Oceanobacillus jeddahense]